MRKSTFTGFDNFDEEIKLCLEHEMIPDWERFGLKHLAVSEKSLEEFREQPLPSRMRTWTKKRKRKKGIKSRKVKRKALIIESWPDDDLHSTIYPVLSYTRRGCADMQFGDYVAQCPQQHFMVFRPGIPRPAGKTPYLEKPRGGRQCEMWRFTLFADNEFVALSVVKSIEDTHINSGQYYLVDSRPVSQLFSLFIQEVMNKPADYVKTAPGLLQTFLWLFLREIKEGRFYNRGLGDLPESTTMMDSPIEMAKQYINKNLNLPLTIETVAQAVFMSKTSFVHHFTRETGQTFNAYVTEQRLKESQHWLRQKSCSIDTVGKFVGLKNSQFHRLFKQHFGMTPTAFRKIQEKRSKS